MSYFDPILTHHLRNALADLGVQTNDYPGLVRNYYVICMLRKLLPIPSAITPELFNEVLKKDEMSVILASVDAMPFSPIRREKLYTAFNLICENGLDIDYIRFFKLSAPALVADWAGFSEKFKDCNWELMLLVLYQISLHIYRASGFNAVFDENPAKIAMDMMKNTEWLNDYSVEWMEECVRCALYIELSCPFIRRKPSYEKRLRDAINQIAAFCDKGDVTAHDCILRYLITQKLTSDEAMNRVLKRFNKVDVTDLLRQFKTSTLQDDVLVLKIVLMQFFEMAKGEMVIYNPSPTVLKEFHHVGGALEKTVFLVPDPLEAQAYQQKFSEYRIYAAEMLPDSLPRNVLILDPDGHTSGNQLRQLLCKFDKPQFLIYAPQTKVSSISIHLEENGLCVDALLGLPTGISQELPAKKTLIFGSSVRNDVVRIMEAERNVQLGRGKTGMSFLRVNALYISRKYIEAPREWLYQNLTIKQMFNMNQETVIGDCKKYRKAREFAWSPEITIFYEIYQRENGNLEGRAYVKSVSYMNGKINYGKKIGELKTRGLRGKSVDTILEKLPSLLFEPERYDEYVPILERLLEDSPSLLSLKTIWYILWRDLQSKTSYCDAICQEMFCGECQDLSNINPATATAEEILEALERVCGFREIPESYLKQLCLIFGMAVERKFFHENKLKYILTSIRKPKDEIENLVSRSRIRTVTDAEITRILEHLMEMDGEYLRYASSSESFYMAMSLFAPIDLVRLRALTWNDVFLDSDMCVIEISKKLSRDNQITDVYPPYHVPCSPIITMFCQGRLDYLTSKCGITAEMLKNEPFFWNDDPCSASDLDQKKEPISHATAKGIQRKMLSIANIHEDITYISDGEKYRPLDLSNPNMRNFWCDNVVTKSALKGLEIGEVCYLLGKTPPDTVDAHYFGFEAPYNLLRMAAIQHRWTAPYEALLRPSSDTPWRKDFVVDGNFHIQSGCDFGMRGFLYFEIEGGVDVKIKIESKYGHEGNITQL